MLCLFLLLRHILAERVGNRELSIGMNIAYIQADLQLSKDLTCDPEPFHPMSSEPINATGKQSNHQVHGGMLRIAQLMGKPGAPVHIAILRALSENPGYDLVLTVSISVFNLGHQTKYYFPPILQGSLSWSRSGSDACFSKLDVRWLLEAVCSTCRL